MKNMTFSVWFLLVFSWNCFSFEGQVKSAYFIDENGKKSWVYLNDIDLNKATRTTCLDAHNPGWMPTGYFISSEPETLRMIYKNETYYFQNGLR